ncbi:hypothetical protein C8K36_10486 [Rhodococcus sp. OK519]|nr:hypothetical protein C8K36_10486 [Rhodococcus sp. OK519]
MGTRRDDRRAPRRSIRARRHLIGIRPPTRAGSKLESRPADRDRPTAVHSGPSDTSRKSDADDGPNRAGHTRRAGAATARTSRVQSIGQRTVDGTGEAPRQTRTDGVIPRRHFADNPHYVKLSGSGGSPEVARANPPTPGLERRHRRQTPPARRTPIRSEASPPKARPTGRDLHAARSVCRRTVHEARDVTGDPAGTRIQRQHPRTRGKIDEPRRRRFAGIRTTRDVQSVPIPLAPAETSARGPPYPAGSAQTHTTVMDNDEYPCAR